MEIKLVIGLEEEFYERIDKLTEAITAYSRIRRVDVKYNEKSSAEAKIKKENKTEANAAEDVTGVPWKEENKQSDIEYTIDDVISAMQNLGAKKGKQEAKKLLGKYNASKVSELDKTVYGNIIKDIEGMI